MDRNAYLDKKGIPIEIQVSSSAIQLAVDRTDQLSVIFQEGVDSKNSGVVWTSSAPAIATVSEDGLVTAAGIGHATIKVTSLANSDVSARCQVDVVSFDSSFTLSLGTVVSAAYSRTLDQIIVIGNEGNQISLINPATGMMTTANLPHPALCMGLALDGLHVAIGYTNYVGTVDLSSGTPVISKTWPITAYTGYGVNRGSIGSIVLDPQGYIYAIDSADQWIALRQIDSATGVEALKSVGLLRAGDMGRLYKDGTTIYCCASYLQRIDISNPGLANFPYNLYTSAGGSPGFWFFDSWNALMTRRGDLFSVTNLPATDMAPGGTLYSALGQWVSWVDHNSLSTFGGSTGLLAVIPEDTAEVCLFGASDLTLRKTIPISTFVLNGVLRNGTAQYCFWNTGGTELYVLVKPQGSSGTSNWPLVVYEL